LPATEALPEAWALRAGFCAGVATALLPEAAGVVAGAAEGFLPLVGCVAVELAGFASLAMVLPVALNEAGFASEPCAPAVEVTVCEPAVAVPVAFADAPEARLLPALAVPEATLLPTLAAPEAALLPRLAAPIALVLPALAAPEAVAVACCAEACAVPVAVPAAPLTLEPAFEAAFCVPLVAFWPTLLKAGELPLSDPPKPP
jgi:hypothetical protein